MALLGISGPIQLCCNRGLRLPLTTALTHPPLLYHSRHDRSREGRELKEVRLGRCGAYDAYGGDKEWRHRDRAVGFVNSTGEAASRSEADGLA